MQQCWLPQQRLGAQDAPPAPAQRALVEGPPVLVPHRQLQRLARLHASAPQPALLPLVGHAVDLLVRPVAQLRAAGLQGLLRQRARLRLQGPVLRPESLQLELEPWGAPVLQGLAQAVLALQQVQVQARVRVRVRRARLALRAGLLQALQALFPPPLQARLVGAQLAAAAAAWRVQAAASLVRALARVCPRAGQAMQLMLAG